MPRAYMQIMSTVGRRVDIAKQHSIVVTTTFNAVNFFGTCSTETKDGKHAGCESRNTPTAYMSNKTLVEVKKNNLDGESAVSTPARGKTAVACDVPKEERNKRYILLKLVHRNMKIVWKATDLLWLQPSFRELIL
ncbi:hypothetical protein GOBAR_DD29890 [Gossypium barbadense]|nr:hypothetical protein GOBAR_DD29890 [Gossypium barbadense]